MNHETLTSLSGLRPLVSRTPGLAREHVLPGDKHAGRDLAACANAWCVGQRTVFCRLRVVTPTVAHVAALAFDADGFGTLISVTMEPGVVPVEIRAILEGADHVVVAADESAPVDDLLLDGHVERRSLSRVRLFEAEVLGLVRRDIDLDPLVWTAARDGDPVAAGHLANAARADLFALVALAGSDITLH